jgi:DNA-binding CsgD family transcriptional regulator
MKELRSHTEGFQRAFGFVGAFLQCGLLLSDYAESGSWRFAPIYVVLAVVFLASARFVWLDSVQVLMLLALAPLQTYSCHNAICALPFAVLGALVAFRRGWFIKNAVAKALAISITVSVLQIIAILASTSKPLVLAPALIAAIIFSFLVFGLAKSKYLAALAPRKRILKLIDYGLTLGESAIVKARLSGMSDKEIAYERGISESRVRNVLSAAYHKLGLDGRDELMTVGERFRVE